MSKSILLSIRPEWVLKILTNKKTIEVRKQFPKDYKGWVYIYCTKGKPYFYGDEDGLWVSHLISSPNPYHWNGKVVARFWCDKVEEIKWFPLFARNVDYYINNPSKEDEFNILKLSCLSFNELDNYLKCKNGYAIHISKLEIFDEPRELNEFTQLVKRTYDTAYGLGKYTDLYRESLTKAPQNYCYIEGEE